MRSHIFFIPSNKYIKHIRGWQNLYISRHHGCSEIIFGHTHTYATVILIISYLLQSSTRFFIKQRNIKSINSLPNYSKNINLHQLTSTNNELPYKFNNHFMGIASNAPSILHQRNKKKQLTVINNNKIDRNQFIKKIQSPKSISNITSQMTTFSLNPKKEKKMKCYSHIL